MGTLLPLQQKHVLIALLFEVVGTSYLVQRSIEATAICGMICCYGHLVTMATEACAIIALLFEVVGTSYLLQRSIEVTAICGMICCYGHIVTMATEACAYSFTV